MPFITTADGTEIFLQGLGSRATRRRSCSTMAGRSAPTTGDNQLLFFSSKGFRVIAHDRRGHGRSTQTADGNDMDTYAADAIALARALDLKDAIHVGHSTGGGEVARYVARTDPGRVSRAVLISAIPPVMVKSDSNPGGTPIEVFDGFRAALAANRSQFYIDVASGPFYNFNKPGVEPIQGLIDNWWRQGMMGGANGHYDCIKVFSETDLTEDLKQIDVPVLVIHSEDDQVVPYADSGPLAVKLLKNGTLKTYQGLPHGCMTTHPDLINADILAFIQGDGAASAQGETAEPAMA